MYKRPFKIAAHIVSWLLFFALVTGFVFRRSDANDIADFILSLSFLRFAFLFIAFFYINLYILVPRFLFKGKYFIYVFSCLLLFSVIFYLKPYERILGFDRPALNDQRKFGPNDFGGKDMPPPMPGRKDVDRRPPEERLKNSKGGLHIDITSVVLFIACMSVSGALCLTKRWRITEQRAARAEADKANAELSFLKTQINPHFLFNTLNNIYLLAIVKSDNTPPSIMKLSNIMRYLTDEVREDFVTLDGEIDCLKDYIDLQSLRLGSSTRVNFHIEGPVQDKKIAPLILMTFIENAFKHGVSKHEQSVIDIGLWVDDKQIKFLCSNRLFPNNKKNTERTGIGLMNLCQRLHYLYPERHELLVTTEDGTYTVNLNIRL